MKRLLSLLLILSLLVLSFVACNGNDTTVDPTPDNNETTTPVVDPATSYTVSLPAAAKATLFVQFTMEGGATFVVELLPKYAPATVANFQKLVGEGFYDGLTFHRVVSGFMIQGGAPADNSPTPDRIEGEFATNGFTQNTLSHERGVISMARSTDPNSASSQFFIVHEDYSNSLDGRYAAFGRVVAGMETVDTIAALEVTLQPYNSERSRPVRTPVITSAYFVEYTAPTAE